MNRIKTTATEESTDLFLVKRAMEKQSHDRIVYKGIHYELVDKDTEHDQFDCGVCHRKNMITCPKIKNLNLNYLMTHCTLKGGKKKW